MVETKHVFLHVWSGDRQAALSVAQRRWPIHNIIEISHQELRSAGWKGQVRGLRALKGEAVLFYFQSLEEAAQIQLVLWSGLIHRCKETVVADAAGQLIVIRPWNWFALLPRTVLSVVSDFLVLFLSRIALTIWCNIAHPRAKKRDEGSLDIAYLFPFPLTKDVAGGAISHIRGVLGGLRASDAECKIFSGATLPVDFYPLQIIPSKRKLYLLWESMTLTYSLRFVLKVRRSLRGKRPGAIYQRHGRFMVAGALLSQITGVPLILEYNGSELWMANYWDPSRFSSWLRLCEEVSIRSASRIVVVSEPIKKELQDRGIPSRRIVVSPNAVDPSQFYPGCGGTEVRRALGISVKEIVVGFVGTFGPWHGVSILQKAAQEILSEPSLERIRFLLVGKGPLYEEIRGALKAFESSGQVIFTGIVNHDRVREYLDAADILVSPHVPLPDGKPFFGSPTKLFEYMAMGKAIVASRLDQLAQVLCHGKTALLVAPANVLELVRGILTLVDDPELRNRLGRRAREAAIQQHTWKRNVVPLIQFARRSHSGQELSTEVSFSKEQPVVDGGIG